VRQKVVNQKKAKMVAAVVVSIISGTSIAELMVVVAE